jgi:uncharacterized repeat protein (TIGR01451 family)
MQNGNVAGEQQTPADEGDDAISVAADDATEGGLSGQAELDLLTMDGPGLKVTPASAKMPGDANRQKPPRELVTASEMSGSLNDDDAAGESTTRSGGRAAVGSDPFDTPDDETDTDVNVAGTSTRAQAAPSRRAINIVDIDDELDADDAGRPEQDAAQREVARSGPHLHGALDETVDQAPVRAASRAPAAAINDDPFAEDEAAQADTGVSRPAASDERVVSDDDDSQYPPSKAVGDSQSKTFQRNLAPSELGDDEVDLTPRRRSSPRPIETDEEPPTRRDFSDVDDPISDETSADTRANDSQESLERVPVRSDDTEREQHPAELSRTIEVDGADGEDIAVTSRPELPLITIEKNAPATAVLGRPMVYHILVRNVGDNPAFQVVVEDVVPHEVKIDGSIPRAQLKDDRLIWKLGTLAAGQERRISVRVVPQSEGTIGGVATVNFAAEPKQNPVVSGPQLKFDVAAPRQVAVGAPVEFSFRVRNTGRVPASGVTIRNVLPAALRHPDGDDLEYEIGQLAAGKTREVKLVLTAAQAGPTVNRVVVTADGNVAEEAQVPLDVVGPALVIVRDGPRRLFPNKTGVYSNKVTNPGLTPVSGISVVETVPAGMEFVAAGDGGTYNAAKRAITWTINQLGPAASKTVTATLRSIARGAQISVVRAYDPAGSSGEAVGATHVSGVCALSIDIGEIPALIEAGETLKVAVRILNRGSDTAANVRTTIAVPAGMQFLSAQGPTSHREATSNANASGESATRGTIEVQFAPIDKIEPHEDAVIELTLKARTPGAARLEVQAQCDQLPDPIRREEVTTIVLPQ